MKALSSMFILAPSSFILASCGVAKLVRHRIVNPAIEGSNPFATANSLPIVNCRFAIGRFMKLLLLTRAPIGNRQSKIENVIDPELE
jgi:hypothetical protein